MSFWNDEKKHNYKIQFHWVPWQNSVFISHVKLFSEAWWWVLKSGRFISIGTTALTAIKLSLSVFRFWHNICQGFWKPPLTCVSSEVSDIQYISISLLFLLWCSDVFKSLLLSQYFNKSRSDSVLHQVTCKCDMCFHRSLSTFTVFSFKVVVFVLLFISY